MSRTYLSTRYNVSTLRLLHLAVVSRDISQQKERPRLLIDMMDKSINVGLEHNRNE